jgi:hypothetical protein
MLSLLTVNDWSARQFVKNIVVGSAHLTVIPLGAVAGGQGHGVEARVVKGTVPDFVGRGGQVYGCDV